jgi:hypothetical protein
VFHEITLPISALSSGNSSICWQRISLLLCFCLAFAFRKIVKYEFGHFAYFSTQVSGFSFFILSSSVCDLHLESFPLEFGL